MKVSTALSFLVAIALVAFSQTQESRPRFADFKVTTVFTGPPVEPKLSKDQRTFRTMIRRGAKSRVEFGGHYTVPMWGCGAGCSAFAIVDSKTGRVYDGFVVAELPMSWENQHGEPQRIEFHANSWLLKIDGCPGERDCGLYDYVIEEGRGLTLIRKQLLPKEYQYPE